MLQMQCEQDLSTWQPDDRLGAPGQDDPEDRQPPEAPPQLGEAVPPSAHQQVRAEEDEQ